MTPAHNGLRGLAAAALAGLATAAGAQSFQPYDGKTGYQELAIAADSFYLAFHGTRDTSGPWVNAAWAARAAQLCAARGAAAFVALRYPDEAVLPTDAAMAAAPADQAWPVPVASGPVYIPIYLPSGPRITSLDAPGKLGAVRCLPAGAVPRDATRLQTTGQALAAARSAGVPVK